MQTIDSGCFYFLAGAIMAVVIGCVIFGMMLAMWEFKEGKLNGGSSRDRSRRDP